MPSSTPQRQARWGISEEKAESLLRERGYKLDRDWCWSKPSPEHEPTEEETDAIIFLIEEWDYGGLRD